MSPDYEKLFQGKRLQASVPEHRAKIVDYLRFYQSTDIYSDLYDHYAPLLAEEGVTIEKVEKVEPVVVEETTEETVEESVVDTTVAEESEDIYELKKAELIELAESLNLDTEGTKAEIIDRILTHNS